MNFRTKLLVVCLISLSLSSIAVARDTNNDRSYMALDYNDRFLEDQIVSCDKPGLTLYVSPTESRGGNGTEAKPFGTLEAARDAIRKIRQSKSGLPVGGIEVILQNGTFQRARPLVLSAEDSGTRQSPIVYRGTKQGSTVVSGGTEIDVAGSEIVKGNELKRLHKKARGNVNVIPISEEQIAQFRDRFGYGMISMDGHILEVAKWPNRGYCHIEEVFDKGPSTRHMKPGEKPPAYSKKNPSGGRFSFRERLSKAVEAEFERSGEMHVQGYLHNDWYFQNEPVGEIENGVVQLLKHTRYGIDKTIRGIPRRVRLVHVLAELDEPGEWYLDSVERKLYFWPIKGFKRNRSTCRILGGEPLVKVVGASFITFSHLVFQNSGKLAVQIRGGDHNLIAASTIRNGKRRGVSIENCTHSGITGCQFYGLESAFNIEGGDRKTLERCYNFATNNEIHSCRRRGYGVIGLDGVGLYFAHNLLHDMNGAVSYKTIDSLFEFNEFYNIGYEMGDFNVMYCGALWHTMNNVVRFNFVHHLFEPGGHPVMAFRNDDGGAGMKVYGNVFYRSGRGSVQFAGPLNDFVNNISIDSYTMWWTNKSPITKQAVEEKWRLLAQFGHDLPKGDKGDYLYNLEKIVGKDGWKKSPWVDEFPQLAKVIEGNPFAQSHCKVKSNYIAKVRNPFHIHGGDGTIKGMESGETGISSDLPTSGVFEVPYMITPQAFVDVKTLNFGMRKNFKLIDGFERIPFEKIGMVDDVFRKRAPDKDAYRKHVLNKFKDDAGGKYDAEAVNARYPRKSYQ